MKIYAAPMEGITGYIYRNAHSHHYPGMDQYYTPFLTPKVKKKMTSKESNDILPEHNQNIRVIPQILTNQAIDFINTAEQLHKTFGYHEVNLNLGCPSKTVVTKGKGSGFLAEPEKLRTFFEEMMEERARRGLDDLNISVKTRLGVEDPEEIMDLMHIYNDYDISELTIHARVLKDYYKYPVRREAFREALKIAKHPVCYNGDIFTKEEYETFVQEFPEVDRIMLGRGLIADPQLAQRIREEKEQPFDYDTFFAFHEELRSGYEEIMSGDRNVLFKMKELWAYMGVHFPEKQKILKKIKKSNNLMEYNAAVSALSY